MDITFQPAVLLWNYRYENYYNSDEMLPGFISGNAVKQKIL